MAIFIDGISAAVSISETAALMSSMTRSRLATSSGSLATAAFASAAFTSAAFASAAFASVIPPASFCLA